MKVDFVGIIVDIAGMKTSRNENNYFSFKIRGIDSSGKLGIKNHSNNEVEYANLYSCMCMSQNKFDENKLFNLRVGNIISVQGELSLNYTVKEVDGKKKPSFFGNIFVNNFNEYSISLISGDLGISLDKQINEEKDKEHQRKLELLQQKAESEGRVFEKDKYQEESGMLEGNELLSSLNQLSDNNGLPKHSDDDL